MTGKPEAQQLADIRRKLDMTTHKLMGEALCSLAHAVVGTDLYAIDNACRTLEQVRFTRLRALDTLDETRAYYTKHYTTYK